MRSMILAATALALLSSTALAQDKAGSAPAPAAKSDDAMSKGDTTKMAPKKKAKKTAKKSSAKSGEDATKQ